MAREWGWLKGGIALGLLSAFAFISYKPLGVSTSYPRTVGLLLNPIAPEFVAENAYFARVPPIVDWQLMLVLGIIVGGFIASRVVARMDRNGVTCSSSPTTVEARGNDTIDSGDAVEVVRSGERNSGSNGEGKLENKLENKQVSGARRRQWTAFAGGFLLLFGARLAGGCTSGHVITGMTQLATASFLFAAAVFAVGIPVAMMTKRKGWV